MKRLQIVTRLVILSLSGSASQAQSPPVPLLHGTVNIILANKNGLIAVTDSRLSAAGVQKGSAQKLFQLDPKTICTIAGTYAIPGPTNPQQEMLGIAVVSRVIDKLTHASDWAKLTTVAESRLLWLTVSLCISRAF